MSKLDMFNKEYSLELLGNKIRYNKEYVAHDIYRLYIKKNEIELLEKYLTELQAIKNSNPSEALKVLNCNHIIREEMDYEDYYTINKALLKAQEQKKVLEIIKEKRINVDTLLDCIRFCNTDSEALEEYNFKVSSIYNEPYSYQLTQEEFDLLKEILGC